MTNRRATIVGLTSELPWPLDTGGHLRTFYLLKAIADEFRVILVTTLKEGDRDGVEALERERIELRAVPAHGGTIAVEAMRAFRARTAGDPYVLFRKHDRPRVRDCFTRTLDDVRPAAVYLDHLDSFAFADLCGAYPLVLDLHNSYSLLAQRAAADERRRLVRWYLQGEARRLRRIEGIASSRVDVLMTVSEQERSYFSSLGARDVRLVPNGVDCRRYAALPAGRAFSDAPIVLYIGTMSWPPNAAAAYALITEIMPKVRERVHGARVCVVGKDPPDQLLRLRELEWADVTAGVPDVLPYLERASVLAVPLDAGGGSRLKILEAFAAGLPVVSTPVGAEGIDARHERELIVAEQTAMVDRIAELLGNPALGHGLAQHARETARQKYDWGVVGRAAVGAVRGAVASNASGPVTESRHSC